MLAFCSYRELLHYSQNWALHADCAQLVLWKTLEQYTDYFLNRQINPSVAYINKKVIPDCEMQTAIFSHQPTGSYGKLVFCIPKYLQWNYDTMETKSDKWSTESTDIYLVHHFIHLFPSNLSVQDSNYKTMHHFRGLELRVT